MDNVFQVGVLSVRWNIQLLTDQYIRLKENLTVGGGGRRVVCVGVGEMANGDGSDLQTLAKNHLSYANTPRGKQADVRTSTSK